MSTREKIIEAALDLFGKNGLHGTSVRQIASQADVNLAAINYHFNSKEELFKEVIAYSVNFLAAKTNEVKGNVDGRSFDDVVVDLFELVNQQHSMVFNLSKLILYTASEDVMAMSFDIIEKEHSGQQFLMSCLEREFPQGIDDESKQWVADIIFTQIIHTNNLLCSAHNHFCPRGKIDKGQAVKTIRRLAKALVKSISE